MAQDTSSVRLSRLHRIMHHLAENRTTSREALMTVAGCNSLRTLQNDLSFLRDEFMADIAYSRKRGRYEIRSTGTFWANIAATYAEIYALAIGLQFSSTFSCLREASAAVWKKVGFFMPRQVLEKGNTLRSRIDVESSTRQNGRENTFQALLNALSEEGPLNIEIEGGRRGTRHTLTPEKLRIQCSVQQVEGVCEDGSPLTVEFDSLKVLSSDTRFSHI